jgi:hypothetical protein
MGRPPRCGGWPRTTPPSTPSWRACPAELRPSADSTNHRPRLRSAWRSAVLQSLGGTTGAFALLRRSASCLALVTA